MVSIHQTDVAFGLEKYISNRIKAPSTMSLMTHWVGTISHDLQRQIQKKHVEKRKKKIKVGNDEAGRRIVNQFFIPQEMNVYTFVT